MEELYSWIKNILIYMIINTIIMNLLGNKSYKKYVSIISGMILVLIVISPVLQLMELEDNLDYYLQANEFSVQTSDFKYNLASVEKKQRDLIFSEYKEQIRSNVKSILSEEMIELESMEITMEQDPDSAEFGEIKSMKISAKMIKEQEESSDGLTIEEIEVASIIIGNGTENTELTVPTPLEISMKNKLSDFYNIEQDNININIQGE